MEKRIYTVATAHLDTSWLWTLEETIARYIPETLHRNFALLEKFPEYVFNFEGAYRYELMEEYYPEDFKRLKEYVAQGRWVPNGSCYENGDVNMPSPEALTRNILYGNGYFREKFGLESNDIFLPDCFGFGRALPAVAAHSGLRGFSTQKLTWGGAVDVPFDVGIWQGSDGSQIWAALKTDAYNTQLKDARNHKVASVNVDESARKYDLGRTMLYYGTGDRGGAPTENSVAQAAKEERENDQHEVKVINSTAVQFFRDLDELSEEQKAKMPVFDGELLLTAHGTGSYTARAVSNRWNRRSELLADAAERAASTAFALGLADYPHQKLDAAWKMTIAHQFHDDITGTSFMECYRRNWNDYVLAMNAFSAEYTAAAAAIAAQMDTSFAVGIPVIVSNPVQGERNEAVCVELPKKMRGKYYRVYDADGTEVPSQMTTGPKGKRTVIFRAGVPSCGWRCYAVRSSDEPCPLSGDMSVTQNRIENRNLIVSIDANGDIASIYDKKLQRELLSAPVRMAILPDENSDMWPSWEIQYQDVMAKPRGFAANPVIRIAENGPARCALEIVRTCEKSTFKQLLVLDADSDYLRVDNETDWRTEASMLKAVFPLAAENGFASYDTGLGSVQRPTNTPRQYEVPAQRWADITDSSGTFGVAVFSDSRVGWDKPDRRTLRLTCVHTPLANCRWECNQHLLDIGLNRYSFGIGGHAGAADGVSARADAFNQPMHTFFAEKHTGTLGSSYAPVQVNNDAVRILAVKKAQATDEIVLRVVETAGKPQRNVTVEFAFPLAGAREIRGDETPLAEFELTEGKLVFDLSKNQIRSFAVCAERPEVTAQSRQRVVSLPYNAVAVTTNNNRADSTLPGKISLPAELMPETLLSGGIRYSLKCEGESAVRCEGQTIRLAEDTAAVHLLLTSLDGDKTVKFLAGEKEISVAVQDHADRLGAWDNVGLGETGWIKHTPQAWTLPHTHNADGDLLAKQFYLFHAVIQLSGAQTLTLPQDPDILVFAAVEKPACPQIVPADVHFDCLEKRPFDYEFSAYAQKMMKPRWFERILDKFTDRTKPMDLQFGGMCMIQTKADLYWFAGIGLSKRGRKKRIAQLQKEWAEQ